MHLIRNDKKRFLPLLLLADPEEAMIDRYLADGELWVWEEGDTVIGTAVVLEVDDTTCELKNLAVDEAWQGRGYGTALVRALAAHYSAHYQKMLVGTSDDGVAFYKRLGFVEDHVVPGFFTKHYAHPIWENGRLCVDMTYLRLTLDEEAKSIEVLAENAKC